MMSERANHPGHDHPLSMEITDDNGRWVDINCHGCGKYMPYCSLVYYCPEDGCEFYLDWWCFILTSFSDIDHPLHYQHPLIPYFNGSPNDQTQLVCNFCTKTTTSGFLLHCAQCEFYLHIDCSYTFDENELFLSKYKFPHFLHCQENHTLMPYCFPVSLDTVFCKGCRLEILHPSFVFKCTSCAYYLHVPCSQVPKETKHAFHPQHTLTLIERQPDDLEQELQCTACHKRMKDEFVLHCTECPFNLDIACAFREATVKYDGHDHLLAFYDCINTKPVDVPPCAACNTECVVNLYRCCGCDFNIHYQCLDLPRTVDFHDHVHPFTLVNSLNEDESGMYHCDICEERREANHGLYVCEGCPSFVSHFECVLPPSYTDEIHNQPWMRRRYREYRETEEKTEPKTPNSESSYGGKANQLSSDIFSQMDREIQKIGETVKELLEEAHWEEVTEQLEKIEDSCAQAQVMLRQLYELTLSSALI